MDTGLRLRLRMEVQLLCVQRVTKGIRNLRSHYEYVACLWINICIFYFGFLVRS